MAQVRKFENGGSNKDETKDKKKSKKSALTKRGVDEVDTNQFVRDAEANFENWLAAQNQLDDSQKERTRKAYREMIQKYANGEMYAGFGNQSIDTTGQLTNNTGDPFDEYKVAQNFLNEVMQHQSVYTPPKLPKFGSSEAWNNFLDKQKINYNLFNQMQPQEQNQFILGMLQNYVNSLDPEEYEDFDANYGQSVLDAFNQAIADQQLSAKEQMDLSRIGIDLSQFYPTEEPEPEKTPLDKAQEDLQLAQTQVQIDLLNQQTNLLNQRNQYTKLPNRGLSLDLSRITPLTSGVRDNTLSSNAQEARKQWILTSMKEFQAYLNSHDVYKKDANWWNQKGSLAHFGVSRNLVYRNSNGTFKEVPDDATNGQIFKYLMKLYSEVQSQMDNGPMPTTAEGHQIMFTANGYARIYDPNTGRMYDKPVAQVRGANGQLLLDVLPEFAAFMPTQAVPSQKNGGQIVKAQFGIQFGDLESVESVLKRQEAEKKAREEKALNEAIAESGKTKEQYLAGQRKPGEEGFTAIDYTRMGAMAMDILSMVSAWVPGYGTAASAVTGVTSTAMNLGADFYDDSVSTGDALKNAAFGLAMDAVGLIPGFGTTGKTAKILKIAIKYVPRIITLANAGKVALDPEVHKSLKKITSDETLTVEDWKNVALAFQTVAGVSRMGAAQFKASAMKQQAKIANAGKTTASIQTKNGEIKVGTKEGEISQSDFETIKNSKNIKDVNAIIQKVKGHENDEILTSRKALTPWQKDISKGAVKDAQDITGYDFSRVAPRFGSVDKKWSDAWIYNRMYNTGEGISSWNPYNWGLKKKAASPNSGSPKESEIRGLISTPKQNRPTVEPAKPTTQSTTGPAAPIQNPVATPVTSQAILVSGQRQLPAPNSRLLGLKMPRRFQLPDGRIAENLAYNGQRTVNNLRRLINSGNWSFMNKREIAQIIPGANNAIYNINDPSKIYFWREGNKVPFVSEKKDVIKAVDGTKLWYDGIVDYDPTSYAYNYDTTKLVNGDMSDDNFDPYVSDVNGLGQGRYKPSVGNDRAYVENFEQGDYYRKFGKDLIGPDGNFTPMGEAWAKAVDEKLPVGSLASFYDENGKIRGRWSAKLNDTYGRRSQTFTNLKDYVNYIRNDGILGARHNVFLNRGKRYFYTDQNGVKHWVDPEVAKNYTISKDPAASGWNKDKTIYWDDYEITAPDSPANLIAPSGNRTEVIGGGDPTRIEEETQINPMVDLREKGLGLGRLLGTLQTNNSIKDTLNKMRPVIYDGPNLFDIVHGALDTRTYHKNRGEAYNHQARLDATTDAALNTAARLEANKQASAEAEKGMLADNQKIEETAKYARELEQKNILSRSELANKNIATIADYNKIKNQLEADHKLKNWEAVSNWLYEQQSEAKQDISDWKDFMYAAEQARAQQEYDDTVYAAKQALNRKIAAGEDYTAEMNAYIEAARKAAVQKWNRLQIFKARQNRWRGFRPLDLNFRFTPTSSNTSSKK